jgi:hypothetical protein
VKSSEYLLEVKYTDAFQYILKSAVLDKIENEALRIGKKPILLVEIRGKRYGVLRTRDLPESLSRIWGYHGTQVLPTEHGRSFPSAADLSENLRQVVRDLWEDGGLEFSFKPELSGLHGVRRCVEGLCEGVQAL